MKQFFGAFFGSIIGIILATILVVVFIIAAVRSSFNSAFKEDKEEVALTTGHSVIRLTLEGQIVEREKENPLKDLGDMGPFAGRTGLGLNELVKQIREASEDKNIKGLYISIKDM